MDECQDVSIKSSIVSRYLAADQALVFLLLLLLVLLRVAMRERVRVRSNVVIRMSRQEQDGIEAEASSIDRVDERLKRDEIRHSDEWSRWVCMGLV